MVELANHPWFLGCQFHPEYKSKPFDPHPLFVSYIRASLETHLQKETEDERMREQSMPAHAPAVGDAARERRADALENKEPS